MELIPSIDLLGGKVVRLYQGDYAKSTVYSDNPVAVAQEFKKAGAARVQIIDLDGARTGLPTNHEIIRRIASQGGLKVQVGGGIRSVETAAHLIDGGVDRVIFGTAAVKDPHVVREACIRFGSDFVIVGVDAKDGNVVIQGWKEGSTLTAAALAKQMAEFGVHRFLYTDTSRDGTMTEPNFKAVRDLVKATGAHIIAAGGIASIDHLHKLAKAGAEAAISGRAVYDKAFDLSIAIEALKR